MAGRALALRHARSPIVPRELLRGLLAAAGSAGEQTVKSRAPN
jgi:hypothetical protein